MVFCYTPVMVVCSENSRNRNLLSCRLGYLEELDSCLVRMATNNSFAVFIKWGESGPCNCLVAACVFANAFCFFLLQHKQALCYCKWK